jgi:P-type conjugative transfer protein TrbJ
MAVTIALSIVLAINGAPRSCAQAVVFDPSNYGQNLLTAARTLEQINNQIKSLENQAQMLINGARNLTTLPTSVVGQLTVHINTINSLIAQAEGLSFNVQKINADFARL